MNNFLPDGNMCFRHDSGMSNQINHVTKRNYDFWSFNLEKQYGRSDKKKHIRFEPSIFLIQPLTMPQLAVY